MDYNTGPSTSQIGSLIAVDDLRYYQISPIFSDPHYLEKIEFRAINNGTFILNVTYDFAL